MQVDEAWFEGGCGRKGAGIGRVAGGNFGAWVEGNCGKDGAWVDSSCGADGTGIEGSCGTDGGWNLG